MSSPDGVSDRPATREEGTAGTSESRTRKMRGRATGGPPPPRRTRAADDDLEQQWHVQHVAAGGWESIIRVASASASSNGGCCGAAVRPSDAGPLWSAGLQHKGVAHRNRAAVGRLGELPAPHCLGDALANARVVQRVLVDA